VGHEEQQEELEEEVQPLLQLGEEQEHEEQQHEQQELPT